MSESSAAAGTKTMLVGSRLRDAREAAGWTVDEVASKLNLTAQAVEALETHKLERLPGLTFARGYIRNYAKILKLDADQLVQAFDQQEGSGVSPTAVQSVDQVGEARRISRGMLQFSAFVVFVIVLAALYYAWKAFNTVESDAASQPAIFERVEVERADGSVHVQTLDEPEEYTVDPGLETSLPDQQDEVLERGLSEPESGDLVSAPEQTLELSVKAQAAALVAESQTTVDEFIAQAQIIEAAKTEPEYAPGMGELQLSFAHDCWLRVVDAKGEELMSGIKRAGESLHLTGKAPLDLHLGYAKGVGVIYNGETVDISSAVRGETARIKLGE